MQKQIRFIIIAISAVLLLGLILYFYNFHDSLSKNPSDWSYFASFQGIFISIASLILLGYISYMSFKLTDSYYKQQNRPIIEISHGQYKVNENVNLESCWYLINCSKSVARNVIIRFKMNRKEDYSKWVSCYAITDNISQPLIWIHYADVINVCYTDSLYENFYEFEYKDIRGTTKTIHKNIYDEYLKVAENNSHGNISVLHYKFTQLISKNTVILNSSDNYLTSFAFPFLFKK